MHRFKYGAFLKMQKGLMLYSMFFSTCIFFLNTTDIFFHYQPMQIYYKSPPPRLVLGWMVVCCEDRPVFCRVFGSVPGLFSLDARSTFLPVLVSRHFQRAPGQQNHPQSRTADLTGQFLMMELMVFNKIRDCDV